MIFLRQFGLFLVLLYIGTAYSQEEIKGNPDNFVVNTVEGQLRGKLNVSRDGRVFYEFLGVRYAENPKRFQMANSVKSWTGVRNATDFGSVCAYYHPRKYTIGGAEDCLFLNVYTTKLPKEMANHLFPVMVFFHEGGFLYGTGGNYGSENFMDENVVIVTINYRLSALGFLSTEDVAAPGNMGLKDQVLSLQWVQRNIKQFNGDANKVTIFGYSAGGASVTYHLLSEMSKGLFHRAIAQSGSALNPWAFAPKPLENTQIIARNLNCSTNTTKEMVTCLQKQNHTEILKLQTSAFIKWFHNPLYVFVPSVERKIGDGKSNFLLKRPREILDAGEIHNNVPLMTGSVQEDGLKLMGIAIASNDSVSKDMNSAWDSIAPITFFYEDSPSADIISEKIKENYFHNQSVSSETVLELSHVYSDRWFLMGIKNFARLYSRVTNNSVFNYVVTYPLPSPYKNCTDFPQFCHKNLGVTHGDDVPLFFRSSWFNYETLSNSEYYNISKIYVKLWVNFATTGDPDAINVTGIVWPKLNPEEKPMKWFHINKEFSMTTSEFMDRSDFWNSLPVSQ